MTLFIENILNNTSPSTIDIAFPVNVGTQEYRHLKGLLTSEVTLSTSNKWGPILNDVSNLQDVASLLGSNSMWTWIGASTMCWKGTDPLKTSIDFYLINYRPNLGIEDGLKRLNYLTSLIKDGAATVHVHGGYEAEVLKTNSSIFNNAQSAAKLIGRDDLTGVGIQGITAGTLIIKLGNKAVLTKMLISRLDVTPSLVEVPDKKPLYYRVSMSLIGTQPLLSNDVDNMYAIGGSVPDPTPIAGGGIGGGGGGSF